ncbi:uncharacterized protein [Linepithema humile]|uniref:uncharacterized protein isoform X2 n=1 Tax=Linepithema humile TaxID=83485 RepID=UPI00351E45E1
MKKEADLISVIRSWQLRLSEPYFGKCRIPEALHGRIYYALPAGSEVSHRAGGCPDSRLSGSNNTSPGYLWQPHRPGSRLATCASCGYTGCPAGARQQSGFVAVVDWSGFSLRQGGALGAAALRNLIAALRGRFPARFKAIHFLSAPLYVQATLALVKPFLDEKTRNKIYLHGNNLSTLHEHLPTDILPAELGGTGPAFNPGLWAEPVIHSAMKEAELAAAAKKGKEQQVDASEQEPASLQDGLQTTNGNYRRRSDGSNMDKTFLNKSSNAAKRSSAKTTQMEVELNVINERSNERREMEGFANKNDKDSAKERLVHVERVSDENAEEKRHSDNTTDKHKDNTVLLDAELNLSEFEMIPNRLDNENNKDSLLDNRLEKKALIVTGNNEIPSEETNLIT